MKKIKLTMNELFSGIGCQRRGFENSGLFDVNVLTTSDIDKEAVLSYAAIHCGLTNEMVDNYVDYPSRKNMAQYLTNINLGYNPEKDKQYDWFKLAKRKSNDIEKYWLACKLTNNLGDISKIEELPYADFWTCSFPCTDISVAGKMKGLSSDSGTRSSLLWQNIRLLKKAKENNTLPQYIMIENVKNLVSKKFINDFNNLLEVLSEVGFNSYWSVINGKDCGVPQNRERVFVISVRKDIDSGEYTFSKPFDNGIRLKDVLEDSVDEKYYVSEGKTKNFLNNLVETFEANKSGFLGNIHREVFGTGYVGGVWNVNKNSPPYIVTALISQKGERFEKISQYAYSLLARDYKGFGNQAMNGIIEQDNDVIRIRKLTPRECYRLMGLTFEDCDIARNIGVSDTHLYKQAGNGIITNCCELLAEHLYKAQYDDEYVCSDENFIKPSME